MSYLENAFNKTFPISPHHQNIITDINCNYKNNMIPFEEWIKFDIDWSENRMEEINNPRNEINNENQDEGVNCLTANENPASSYNELNNMSIQKLNSDQRKVYNVAMESSNTGEQLLLLICGGPGTGKTFTADLIIKNLETKIFLPTHALSCGQPYFN